jgi:hypothetical protein
MVLGDMGDTLGHKKKAATDLHPRANQIAHIQTIFIMIYSRLEFTICQRVGRVFKDVSARLKRA